MRPNLTVDDPMDGRGSDRELLGQASLSYSSSVAASYESNIAARKSRHAVILSPSEIPLARECPVRPCMQAILAMRDPFQVTQRGVGFVQVAMIDFAPLRCWAEKCESDKAMDEILDGDTITAQGDAPIPCAVSNPAKFFALARLTNATNSPRGMHFVQAFVANDGTPFGRVWEHLKLLLSGVMRAAVATVRPPSFYPKEALCLR